MIENDTRNKNVKGIIGLFVIASGLERRARIIEKTGNNSEAQMARARLKETQELLRERLKAMNLAA